jgi:hypothetical protein
MLRNILLSSLMLAISLGIMLFAGVRDESIRPVKFDCRMLIGSWHPDVPQEVIKECRKKELNK